MNGSKGGELSDIAERPVAYRVWWEHHSVKLTSGKSPPQEFRDFTTKEEALAFKQSQRETHPCSVFCVEPIYLTGGGPKRRARRRSRQ
jgi:hypothetical protein